MNFSLLRQAITSEEAARFLQQAQFSSTPAEVTQVQQMGFESWINAQINRPLEQTGWDWLVAKGFNQDTSGGFKAANSMMWYQLIGQDDQFRKRVALALSEYFVVSAKGLGGVPKPKSFAIAAWWDLLNGQAFGNFRTLLERVTLSFPMGKYLSTLNNQRANAQTGRAPDENYAREVMQLFTIGLVQLNLDGTPKLDAAGNTLDTYTQDDITNLSRVFTGWHANLSDEHLPDNPARFRNPMRFAPRRHSPEDIQFLGLHIPAGTDGELALEMALDHLFNHPNAGPFFCRQMIQRLVTSNPSPAYVKRVAQRFNNNGQGVRGDLAAVFKAILLDREARQYDPQNPSHGKIREPMVCFVQWAKTFNAQSENGEWNIPNLERPLGQSPFTAASVFNFFRPDYALKNVKQRVRPFYAPEMEITNESTTASYANFMQAVVSGRMKQLKPDYSSLMGLADQPDVLVARLNTLLCAGQLSHESAEVIAGAVADSETGPRGTSAKVATAVFLVMISPDYRVQR